MKAALPLKLPCISCLLTFYVLVDLELSDCTSEDEVYHEKISDSEVHVSIKTQECELLDVNHNLECRIMCVMNMAGSSIFDIDENCDSLIFDQHQVDADGAHSADRGVSKSTSHESILDSCTECSSPLSEVNANVNCASLNNTIVMPSPQNDPNYILKVSEEVNLNSYLVPNLENVTTGGNSSMPFPSDKCNSTEALASAESSSLRTVPLYTGQLHSLPVNKCSIYSPIKVLNSSSKPQSSLEVRYNASNDAFKLHFHNQNHFLNHPRHVSKHRSRKRLQDHHLQSNCKYSYVSPLRRDELSSINTFKSSDRQNSNSSVSVLLTMKFPKDYTLPSKERLEKKFSVFGSLDYTRTKIFFYTGVAQVVFLHQSDAVVAYNYVTRKRMFGQANVRFWLYKSENCRNVSSSNLAGAAHSSPNLKSCLRKPCDPALINGRKNSRVRFRV